MSKAEAVARKLVRVRRESGDVWAVMVLGEERDQWTHRPAAYESKKDWIKLLARRLSKAGVR